MKFTIEITEKSITKTLDTGKKVYTETMVVDPTGQVSMLTTGPCIEDQLETDGADEDLIDVIGSGDEDDIFDYFNSL